MQLFTYKDEIDCNRRTTTIKGNFERDESNLESHLYFNKTKNVHSVELSHTNRKAKNHIIPKIDVPYILWRWMMICIDDLMILFYLLNSRCLLRRMRSKLFRSLNTNHIVRIYRCIALIYNWNVAILNLKQLLVSSFIGRFFTWKGTICHPYPATKQ